MATIRLKQTAEQRKAYAKSVIRGAARTGVDKDKLTALMARLGLTATELKAVLDEMKRDNEIEEA